MFIAARVVVLVQQIGVDIFRETSVIMRVDFSVTLVGSVASSLGI